MRLGLFLTAIAVFAPIALGNNHQVEKDPKKGHVPSTYIHYYGIDGPLDSTNVEYQLECFHHRLKSFVIGKIYDVRGFELLEKPLRQRLWRIGKLIKQRDDKMLSVRFTHVGNMFREMKECTKLLKLYTHKHAKDQGLIYKAIKLNVRLLTFFNSDGTPEPSGTKCGDNLPKIKRTIKTWRREFKEIPNVPACARIIFQIQVSKAANTLRVLKSYCPRK